jgi:hypothetical protein
MSESMLRDEKSRPDLFWWYGAIADGTMQEWAAARSRCLPQDLLALWCRTGGGTIFESETIFAPVIGQELGDDLDSNNLRLWGEGLPTRFLVFHEGGVGISAVELDRGEYVLLDANGGFAVQGVFESLEDWYVKVIRAEYAARYGLR